MAVGNDQYNFERKNIYLTLTLYHSNLYGMGAFQIFRMKSMTHSYIHFQNCFEIGLY